LNNTFAKLVPHVTIAFQEQGLTLPDIALMFDRVGDMLEEQVEGMIQSGKLLEPITLGLVNKYWVTCGAKVGFLSLTDGKWVDELPHRPITSFVMDLGALIYLCQEQGCQVSANNKESGES